MTDNNLHYEHDGIQDSVTGTDSSYGEDFCELLKLAQGDRPARDYALCAGITEATYSRIMHKVSKPSLMTLAKLTSKDAEPQNGITFEILVEQARTEGFLSDAPKSNRFRTANKTKRESEARTFHYAAMAALQSNLLDSDDTIRLLPGDEFLIGRDRRIDWESVYITHEGSELLHFKNILSNLVLRVPNENDEHVVFTNSEKLYELACSKKDRISYRGKLLFMMINWEGSLEGEKPKIVKGEVISKY